MDVAAADVRPEGLWKVRGGSHCCSLPLFLHDSPLSIWVTFRFQRCQGKNCTYKPGMLFLCRLQGLTPESEQLDSSLIDNCKEEPKAACSPKQPWVFFVQSQACGLATARSLPPPPLLPLPQAVILPAAKMPRLCSPERCTHVLLAP